ncbi:MAG TPA: acyltransferase [Acidobacteriaceae bacterium]|jgi:peptidoglycan/LPS O-acetylase OafA/YrhL|nr:acyltransferase [Acidobacteriaceae bacterium]
MTNQPSNVATGPVAGPSKHLPALDGVRGLAILMVLVDHLMLFNNRSGNRWMDSLSSVRGLGGTGVDLFFVLSGFLITGILYDTVQDAHYFRNFYMRRFLRIFPLYYGFLFVLLILTPILHVTWGGRQYVLLGYLQNTAIWFPVAGFHPAELVDLNHFWSLAVEEQFYLFWPMLVFLVKDRRRLMQLALILSACALALRILLCWRDSAALSAGIVHAWTLCRMDTLMIGGFLALWMRGGRIKIPRLWIAVCFWIPTIWMVTIAAMHPGVDVNDLPFVATFGYSMLAVAFAALISMSLQPGSVWNRLFRMAWLRSLGKYSYGIYVLHILIGHLFAMWMYRIFGESLRNFLTPRLHSRIVAILIEFVVTACVVYAAAWLSYNLYEVHFLRLKRYFASRSRRAKLPGAEVPQTVEP